MLLEIATTVGAVAGATLAAYVAGASIAIVFGCVMIISAALSLRRHLEPTGREAPDSLAVRLRLDGAYPTPAGPQAYHVHRVPLGFALMFVAGGLSGLLGIGSGAIKVLALDTAMRLPFKVSTTTSNFMIGVTAAASTGVYLRSGYVDPGLAMPVVLGVLLGSLAGARALPRLDSRWLRWIFAALLAALGAQMIASGASGMSAA
jgi:uncharacterized membrane protein YfcA